MFPLILALALSSQAGPAPAAIGPQGRAPQTVWPWAPDPALVTVETGEAALASAEGVLRLVGGEPGRSVPSPAYVEVVAGSRLGVAWPRRASLQVEGPAALEWREGSGGLVLGLVEARGLHVECRRGGSVLELEGGWRLEVPAGAVYLASRPTGGWTLQVDAGGPAVLSHPHDGGWRRRESLPAGTSVVLKQEGILEVRSELRPRILGPQFSISPPAPEPTPFVPIASAPGPAQAVELPGPALAVELPGPALTVELPGPALTVELPGPATPAPRIEGAEPRWGMEFRLTVPQGRGVPSAARNAGESLEERKPPPLAPSSLLGPPGQADEPPVHPGRIEDTPVPGSAPPPRGEDLPGSKR